MPQLITARDIIQQSKNFFKHYFYFFATFYYFYFSFFFSLSNATQITPS